MLIQNRRDFLKMMALAGAVSSPLTNLLNPSLSFATGTSSTPKNLIVINLRGGFDTLAAFPYFMDPNFGPNDANNFMPYLRNEARPNIFTLPATTLSLANAGTFNLRANNYMGFSPSLAALKPIYDAGGMALIQGVGITKDSAGGGSHDFCENCYSFGRKDFQGAENRGWFAALIEQMGLQSNQAFGFGCAGRPDFITRDSKLAPMVGNATEDLQWNDPSGASRLALNRQATLDLMAGFSSESPAQNRIRDALASMIDTTGLMGDVNTSTNPGGSRALIGTYPQGGDATLGPALRSVARIIAYNHGSNKNQLFYTVQAGFDTHANQGGYDGAGAPSGNLHGLLAHVGASISALVTDLKNPARPNWQNTAIILYSEFGRSVKQTGGAGSDHGAGGTFLMMGGGVSTGVYGTAPTKQSMSDYNLILPSIEFQNLLSPAVRWFGGNDLELFPRDLYTRNSSIADGIIT